MTPYGLARLRELDAEASPAPWHWAEVDFPEDYSTTETVFEMLAGRNAKRIIPPLKDSEIDHDAILLTTARNALPKLLDHIEALEAQLCEAKTGAWDEAIEMAWSNFKITRGQLRYLHTLNPYKENKK